MPCSLLVEAAPLQSCLVLPDLSRQRSPCVHLEPILQLLPSPGPLLQLQLLLLNYRMRQEMGRHDGTVTAVVRKINDHCQLDQESM